MHAWIEMERERGERVVAGCFENFAKHIEDILKHIIFSFVII
jgi:hypothetical protein